jgi:NIMA (never in mitosis gene a)-related kinase 1/4/5
MHKNNVIHRDIKALNTFVFEDKVLKIGDLGESRILNSTSFLKGKTVGTPLFLSPEVIKEENYDHRVDIWGLGCLMYHLTNLEPPFNGDSFEELTN